ncbi:hypothetical protein [Bacillus smithii]|uniref:hypothetical protein n=1 Tax=Bacillus smithii TaxID=1479 RepID=UPI003D225681
MKKLSELLKTLKEDGKVFVSKEQYMDFTRLLNQEEIPYFEFCIFRDEVLIELITD